MTDTVLLLHGLARTRYSMAPIQRALEAAGHDVINHGYPSRRATVESLAEQVYQSIRPRLMELQDRRLHCVTHSMGGILLRQILSQHRLDKLGRVVMLAPPNQGSELVDKLGGLGLFRLVNGPAGRQLGTQVAALPARLPPVDFELGVIAGNRSISPMLSRLLPKPNDGKVSVASTRVEGMRDFCVLPVTHTFMMRDRRVITEVLHFLMHGRFSSGQTA